jgi:hypothetical protein
MATPKTPFRKRKPEPKQDPIVEQVTSIIPNLWMDFAISYQSIDFSSIFAKYSSFIAISLNILYLSIKFYQQDYQQDKIVQVKKVVLEDTNEFSFFLFSVLIINKLDALEYLLILGSIANTIWLFHQSKKVILFNQPTQSQFPSSEYSDNWDLEKRTRNAKLTLLEVGTIQDGQNITEPTLKWVMNVWAPLDASLYLFTWFSPAQVLMMYLSGNPNCGILVVCGYLTAFMVFNID